MRKLVECSQFHRPSLSGFVSGPLLAPCSPSNRPHVVLIGPLLQHHASTCNKVCSRCPAERTRESVGNLLSGVTKSPDPRTHHQFSQKVKFSRFTLFSRIRTVSFEPKFEAAEELNAQGHNGFTRSGKTACAASTCFPEV